jgi:excisionase family DNA binding protein
VTPRIALTREEAAQATGVSLDTIRRAIRAGHLKAKRSGKDADGNPSGKYLIRVSELEAWVDSLEDA